jgi:hypothetical protein
VSGAGACARGDVARGDPNVPDRDAVWSFATQGLIARNRASGTRMMTPSSHHREPAETLGRGRVDRDQARNLGLLTVAARRPGVRLSRASPRRQASVNISNGQSNRNLHVTAVSMCAQSVKDHPELITGVRLDDRISRSISGVNKLSRPTLDFGPSRREGPSADSSNGFAPVRAGYPRCQAIMVSSTKELTGNP